MDILALLSLKSLEIQILSDIGELRVIRGKRMEIDGFVTIVASVLEYIGCVPYKIAFPN